jgi:hypothetical protein
MTILNRYDYLLSALAALEPIGSVPPVTKSDFFAMVRDSKGPIKTVETILLSDDLSQYEAFLAKEITEDRIDFAVLSLEKSENEPVLPDFLLPEEQAEEKENTRLVADSLWSRYFHYAARIAKHNGSRFLKAWVGFEVGLRNALTTARAQILDLEPETYLVCPELADIDIDYSNIISAWHAGSNPLAALEVLDKARWDWLDEHGSWYSFGAGEIEVYAAKLILLHHWRRILAEKQQSSREPIF